MKLIDILNKIANEEEIGKFKIMGMEHYIDDDNFLYAEDGKKVEWFIDDEWLNMPVEIIEEDKKTKKIKFLNCDNYVKKENYETILTMQEIALDIQTLKHKINEIIDYLEEKK